jgi:hypothetical protein
MTSDQGFGAAHRALDAALDAAGAEQAAMNAAAGRRTVALAQVLAAVEVAPEVMLDVDVARVVQSSGPRRRQVAHRALVAEVALALGVGEHAARGLLADAEVLATKATATLDALCSGVISYAHASRLADEVADLPAAAVAEVEAAVLSRGPGVTAARFGALARAARDRLHPVPAEVRHAAAALKADVWVDEGKDGMSWLTAHLPTPVAHAAYDRLTRTAIKAKDGGDPRGVGQLRAAALTALVLDVDEPAETADAGGGVRVSGDGRVPGTIGPAADPVPPDPLTTLVRSVRPTVHVTVPVTTLAGTDERAALLDGTVPIDAETARHLTARAPTLRRVLTDPATGAMLTVDRQSYVVPADLRAFLTARDLTCRFPGCRVPATRCDVDHTTAWAHGGTTDADNLAHLCRAHHTMKHESRWRVEHLHNGVLAWTSPRGRTYLTRPGTADHTLDLLDTWAAEAAALAAENVSAFHAEDPQDQEATVRATAAAADPPDPPPF